MPNSLIQIEQPNEKQKEFFKAKTRFVGYGGARGGGKSWALRRKAMLLAVNYAGIRILILRRTFPQIRENHIKPMMKELHGLAKYRDSDKTFTFNNGSQILFGYCDSEADVLQYQGNEYDVICLDEATHFTEYQFTTLAASVRGTNSFPKRMYLTCNPGGVGHLWVKRLFIDRQYIGKERAEDYTFIQANVYDNTALMEMDPDYVQMLENLPDGLRQAWLFGDWDVLEGRYFKDWDRALHVMEPFDIPKNWDRYFAMDYGMDMFAGYWIAMDTSGRAYVYREAYAPGLIVSEAATMVAELTPEKEEIYAYIAPPDMWNRRQETGRSVADIFAEYGIYLTQARNDRVQGWYDLAEWLRPTKDEFGNRSANLRIFSNCTNLIRSLPMLVHDQKDPNDCAKEPHEITHAPDALRYFCAGRPAGTYIPPERDDESVSYDDQWSNILTFGR